MSRDSPQHMPPDLRDALEEATAEGSPEEKRLDYDTLWALLDSAKPPASELPDAQDTWRGVRAHLDSDVAAPTEVSSRKREARDPSRRSGSSRRTEWAWSAVAAFALLAAVGAWLWFQPITVTSPPGSSLSHTLPDGSVVELNGGSRLAYSRTFSTIALLEGDRRAVEVEGEAYVEVRSGQRPFVIRTTSAHVEALGTAFSVRTDRASQTHVALAEGSVRVQGRRGAGRSVTLQPGQAVRVKTDGSVSAPADTSIERVTAWRRGGFAVTAQPLPAIAEAIEHQYGTPVRLSSSIPSDLRSSPLTLYYSDEVGVETVLHDISMARGLSYRPSAEGGYVVSDRANTGRQSGASK